MSLRVTPSRTAKVPRRENLPRHRRDPLPNRLLPLRLHIPLIEPDVRFPCIRSSDQVHPQDLRNFRSTQGFTRPMVS